MNNSLHVIFGAGQIGQPLAALLRSRGHAVRVARRWCSVQVRTGRQSRYQNRPVPALRTIKVARYVLAATKTRPERGGRIQYP
ncbi:MAG: hypothetical protein ABL982_06235, partial [Vicinamibacterales bacterium]